MYINRKAFCTKGFICEGLLMSEDIFEVKINEEGKRSIQRIYTGAKTLLLLCIIDSVFSIVRMLPTLKFLPFVFNPTDYRRSAWFTILNLVYRLFYIVVTPMQGYFYFKFSKMTKQSLVTASSKEYNMALSFLVKIILLFTIGLLANIIYMFILIKLDRQQH